MASHDVADPKSAARSTLRRFLRARWEDGDPRLFTVAMKPSARKPGVAPVPGRPPVAAQPTAPASAIPGATAPVTPDAAGRHASGIFRPEQSDRGKALLAQYDRIHTCLKCPLGKTRTKFVFGTGNPDAQVVFVGEAPGEQEDKQGLPFVGPAGHLLTRMIEAAGIPRDTVFIANVLKCRPPNNRPPEPAEIEQCEPYLVEQIRLINPRVVVALGKYASQTLLKTEQSIGQLRGKWYTWHGSDLFATYHPSAGLRSGDYKKTIEDDLKLLKARLDTLPPAKG